MKKCAMCLAVEAITKRQSVCGHKITTQPIPPKKAIWSYLNDKDSRVYREQAFEDWAGILENGNHSCNDALTSSTDLTTL